MSSIFADGALHPGRDANDASWLVLRRPEDWAGALRTNVVIDRTVPALFLQPLPLAGVAWEKELIGEDGTRYRADPDGDQVLWLRPCGDSAGAAGWTRMVGARGGEAGKLRRPLGLALDPTRGLLAIADADNHRVQVVRSDGGEPLIVLGCSDAWGRGVAPTSSSDRRALAEPVAVAFFRHQLAIADRAGGKVHLYDQQFRWLAAFTPRPPHVAPGFVPAPVAVALVEGAIWVLDAGWSVPVAYDHAGHVLEDVGAAPAAFASWLTHARCAARGELVLGPIDGRTEDLAWHRVVVDATVTEGAAIEVQTFASDDSLAPSAIPWAPAQPSAIPLADTEPRSGESSRPLLSDQGRWQRKRGEPYLRTSRPIGRLDGSGPIDVASFSLAWPLARRLRALDTIELNALGALTPALPIAAIAGRPIHAVARGDLQPYGAGSSLTLLERDGAAPLGGARLLATFSAGDSFDLSVAVDDDTLYDLPASHAVAALLRDGDVVRVDDGVAAHATVVVGVVDLAPATLLLALPVVGDFSRATLRIVAASERLVVDQLAWSEHMPAGESLFVHDDAAGTVVAATVRWAERDVATLWLEPGPAIPWASWTRFSLPEPLATDRGRYLWLRLRLLGAVEQAGDEAALSGPLVRSVRLLLPRLSYLRYLPAVYSRRDDDDPSGALFLERLLALPEARLTAIEARYEEVARALNPRASSPDWLRFLAAWYGLAFDPSWPIERRRELLVNAHALFAARGTVDGIRRYLEIYLGSAPAIIEGFQWGVLPAQRLGGDDVLGSAVIGPPHTLRSDERAHYFSIWVFADGGFCASELTDKAARAIIDSIKPAHTRYELHVVDGPPRVGITAVGIDMVLLGGAPQPPLGASGRPAALLGQLSLPPARHPAQRLAPMPLDDDFTLT